MAMAMRRPHLRLLLPLVLLAAYLALASGTPWTRLKNRFRKHHVDFPQSPANFPNSYCEMMMWKRGIYRTFINTFIHAPMRSIKRVCSVGGIHISTGLRKSIFHFSVTTCRYSPQIGSYIEENYSRHIVIGCWNRLPVLYVE
ncbi:ribonuclease-like [Trachemys scripta elegans]|uniref:ribonuclease-like n=1 Tax=Trachemys scripta elegans TaxID=31138 RepID=UPI001551AA78|nr:ribonuclease-like [Trachemys scripta elegans]